MSWSIKIWNGGERAPANISCFTCAASMKLTPTLEYHVLKQ